jgi:hypothetical protein
MSQARMYPPARELLDRRKLNGDGGMEALRALKRRLSDVVYRAMLTGQKPINTGRCLTDELETDTRRHDTLDTSADSSGQRSGDHDGCGRA